ncbi:MAG: L-2-amino-thiazoline-4-carboxylic acid hydrolase [Candidatus Nanopelagicales bacterium]
MAKFVDGTGQPFDFSLDNTECGAVKSLHAQGADELAPYLCAGDYALAEAMGAGLTRTGTLAWGCDRCDFRWTAA